MAKAPVSAPSACPHHWIIETPNGSSCAAYCRRCGVTRAFATTIHDFGGYDSLRSNEGHYARREMR